MSAVFCQTGPLRLQLSKLSVRAQIDSPQNPPTRVNGGASLLRTLPASELAALRHSANQRVSLENLSVRSILDPSAQFADVLWMRGNYQTQIIVGDTESTESVVRRFKKACMQANIVSECRRRKFHETTQDIKKRKVKESSRARKMANKMSAPRVYTPRPQARGPVVDEQDANDNWADVSK